MRPSFSHAKFRPRRERCCDACAARTGSQRTPLYTHNVMHPRAASASARGSGPLGVVARANEELARLLVDLVDRGLGVHLLDLGARGPAPRSARCTRRDAGTREPRHCPASAREPRPCPLPSSPSPSPLLPSPLSPPPPRGTAGRWPHQALMVEVLDHREGLAQVGVEPLDLRRSGCRSPMTV
jgi:hypothetical protein